MSENTLRIQLKGTIQDNENVRLVDFIDELMAVRETLNGIEHTITKAPFIATDYRIIDLKHGSAEVLLEAVPRNPQVDISSTVLNKFVMGVQQIQAGSAPEEFDSSLLERFAKLARGLRKNVTHISFSRNGSQVMLGKTFEAQIVKIIGEDELAEGSLNGVLEQINLHRGANVFVIYPIVGPKEVRCRFPEAVMEKAIHGINRYVGVSG